MTRMQPEGERPPAAAGALLPTDAPILSAGMMVVHFDPEPAGHSSFCRSMALGPEIVDPCTNDWWAPVLRADRVRDLVPSMLVVATAERG